MKILALNLANINITTKMEKVYHTVKTEHDKKNNNTIQSGKMAARRYAVAPGLFVSLLAFFHRFLVSYFECFSREIPQTKMLSCARDDK